MDPKLLIVFKLLDIAALGYEQFLAVQPALTELRIKLERWRLTGVGPSQEEWDELNGKIDGTLAELRAKAEEDKA